MTGDFTGGTRGAAPYSANGWGADRLPIDATSRGKVRALFKEIDDWAEAVERAYEDKATRRAFADFALRKGKGRARALRRLQTLFSGLAVWTQCDASASWLYMRRIKRVDTGVELCSICVSQVGGQCFFFPVEFTEHALARVVQRGGNPIDAVYHAGLGALALSMTAIQKGGRFRIKGGEGAFCFDLLPGPVLRASTWLHFDQMSELQELEIVPLGEKGDRFFEHFLDELQRRVVVQSPGARAADGLPRR
jgi:hypothetical protein